MPILFERGYLIPAVNTDNVDYVDCAIQLANSIKQWHPDVKICLMTDTDCNNSVFDHVTILPHGDQSQGSQWKLRNDWQVFSASPFRQTIKLEADMVATGPVDHWWTMFEHRDLVISTGCRDFYDQPAKSRYYRKLFDVNHLPDVYNAITYWRFSPFASEFFKLVKKIFNQWNDYKTLLKFPDNEPTTDVVYAMVAVILGVENCVLPNGYGPQIVHMKRHIIPTYTSNWTKELVWENTQPGLRINTIAQHGFVHYHNKEWRMS